ncbi:MAG: tryptophan--tRNA ligase [Heliobacteriaceae bacterium]|jgi:tryptophanyl-tRNA synthetase|nr:tryptophan--tRNA ligase [Heliobacteriaceae bacterium]
MKEIILSGMRPTGKLHLGHYLGVIQNWVRLQEDYNCFFFAADWHALTTKYDKTETLRQDTLEVVIDWLACGINPEISAVYVQSGVPEIAELNTYLSMVTPQNWVERDPTLKDMVKMLHSKEGANSHVSYGLMGYPVLMSADIMMFNAHAVPVGIDQVAHIEITRDIAGRFNNIYKTDFFVEPKPLLNNCSLICGLDGNKMGKSYGNDIKISDTAGETSKKIMSAITDPARIRRDDPGNPEHCAAVFKYWKIFGTPEQVENTEYECKKGLRGCTDCKKQLGDIINEKFAPIRERRSYYEKNVHEVTEIIRDGTVRARAEARKNLERVKDIIGIYR